MIFSMGRKGTYIYNNFQEDMPCDYDLKDESSFDEVYLSGLTKQDYIIACILQKEIVVRGSPKLYKALKNTLCDLMRELKENGSYTDEQWETLGFAVRLIEEFKDNEEMP